MGQKKIRALIVDDSMFFRAAISRALTAAGDIEVVGEAYDPYDARDKIVDTEPDVMTLDIEMPYMNGVDFLKVLLPQWPIPVVVVSSARARFREAQEAGALYCLPKPVDRSPGGMSEFMQELVKHIRTVAAGTHSRYMKHEHYDTADEAVTASGAAFEGFIALGASTGGTQSTALILRALPADMPGMVIVQHMPPEFTRMYAENLDKDCAMNVREAKDGDVIQRGVALIAPGGSRHLEVVRRAADYGVRLYEGEKVNGHCPSVDVLFHSVAKVIRKNEAVGVILTGMGADGAKGLLAMRQKGCFTVGQDEKTCVVYGMPKEAYELGAVTRQEPLGNIASVLVRYAKDMRS
ncbi:MAG: chemotaxis response regulator protein-glutamate methylesterase [Oscillospiraceae bacterium]|jgi:two-component system chemotaxis response regulator CheB|nr:chemotaxis response regulator protein-glutamate methylesterase [Oscillospiraceae bacterium]